MVTKEVRKKTETPHHIDVTNYGAYRIQIRKSGYDIRVVISGTSHKNKRDLARVEKLRDEWLYLISQGKPVRLESQKQVSIPSKYLTFREAAEKYLLIGTEHCAPATIKDFKKHLNAHWFPAFGNYDLEEITTELIQEYFADKKLQGHNYSSKTKTAAPSPCTIPLRLAENGRHAS